MAREVPLTGPESSQPARSVAAVFSVALSSLSNFMLMASLYATEGTSTQIASIAIVLTTAFAVLSVLRMTATVAATRMQRAGDPRVVPMVLTLVAAAIFAFAVIALALVGHGASAGAAWVFAFLIVSVFSQEGLRILHLSSGHPGKAAVMDLLWVCWMVPAMIWTFVGSSASPTALVTGWGLGGLASAGLGAWLFRSHGRPGSWFCRPPDLTMLTLAAAPAISALIGTTVVNLAVPGVYGDEAFISYRAALTACTPIALLSSTFPSIILSHASHVGHGQATDARMSAIGWRLGALMIALFGSLAALLVAMPESVWQSWLGPEAYLAQALFPPVALGVLGGALLALPVALWHAFRSVRAGSGVSISFQWLALAGLLIPALMGRDIVQACWISTGLVAVGLATFVAAHRIRGQLTPQ